MKLKFILFFLLISSITFGQAANELELVGSWKVESVQANFSELSEEQQNYIKVLKTAFSTATFIFTMDKNFKIDIDFEDISNQMKNAYWKYNHSTSKVTIVDWQDRNTDEPSWEWPIVISKKEGKTYFTLTDANFVLEVTKR